MSKEEKKQLLIDFCLFINTKSSPSFPNTTDIDNFLFILPDEEEKSAEEKAFEAAREAKDYNDFTIDEQFASATGAHHFFPKYTTFNDYKNQTP